MSNENDILRALGRIEEKLDNAVEVGKEHREDDKRRFGEVYTRLGEHDVEIATAKGAAGAIRWLIGGGLVALGTSLAAIAKAFGKL